MHLCILNAWPEWLSGGFFSPVWLMTSLNTVVVHCRRWKAGRDKPIDKETLMKDMEEQEVFPENFSNDLYNPMAEVKAYKLYISQ